MNFLKRLEYHHSFLIIGLIFGLWIVFINPPWHANDEDRHFYNTYNLVQGHLGPQVKDGVRGFVMPKSLDIEILKFQNIPFSDKIKLNANIIDDVIDKELNPSETSFVATSNSALPPFPYLPSAIMIAIGSIFKSSPVWLCWWGRIGALFAYLALIYFAIKTSPYFKPLIMLAALSPMALYQGASITYDSLSIGFLFLFFALVISYYFQEEKITWKQILILFAVAFAQRLSKDGYFILFFSAMFIPISKFQNKQQLIGLFVLMVIASFLPPQLWNGYINSLNLPKELAFQKDFVFDLSKNIHFFSSQPFEAIKLIILNILEQGNIWVRGSLGRFGYSYSLLPMQWIILYVLMLIYVVISESKAQPLSYKFRLPILALIVMNCLAIVVMFFFASTPIGGHFIHGLQGRYFTPMFPFIFAFAFYTSGFSFKSNWLKWIVPVFSIIGLWYAITFIDTQLYSAF